MSTVAQGGEEQHAGPSVLFYTGIAIFLAIVTFVELGPLFEWFNLPTGVLIVMSAVKFFCVVAFFMHLWDDAAVFSRVFVVPLIGSVLMVVVLMAMFHALDPSPREDPFVMQERHYENWNSECSSWLRSSVSNRPYCASPPIDPHRLALYTTEEGMPAGGPPAISLTGMGDNQVLAALRERGQQIYDLNCATCHQGEGQGVPGVYPPLANSDYLQSKEQHIDVVLRGLSGPITVNGQPYNGVMAGFASLNDFNVAAVVTYERTSWGNDLGVVLPEEVARRR